MKYQGRISTFECNKLFVGGDQEETALKITGGSWASAEARAIDDGMHLLVYGELEWDDLVRYFARIAAQKGYCTLNHERLREESLISYPFKEFVKREPA